MAKPITAHNITVESSQLIARQRRYLVKIVRVIKRLYEIFKSQVIRRGWLVPLGNNNEFYNWFSTVVAVWSRGFLTLNTSNTKT